MSLVPAAVETRMGTELYTKYSSFMPAGDISKTEFSTLVLTVLQIKAKSNAATSAAPHASAVISTIKIWAV